MCGSPRGLGSVGAGKLADQVSFDADPLAGIAHLSQVEWVMHAGLVYQPDSLRGITQH